MKNFLGIDTKSPSLERSFKAASELKGKLPTYLEMESLPLNELSYLVEDIHVKTHDLSQNTELGMGEFLGIYKALQSIQGELLNNTSKLRLINASKGIPRSGKK